MAVNKVNKVKTTRKDSMTHKHDGTKPLPSKILEDNDTRAISLHNLEVFNLPDFDLNDPEQFKERINDYLKLCIKNNMKPTVEGLALAFGRDRKTIWQWCNHIESDFLNESSRNLLRKTYSMLNSNLIDLALNNKANPVFSIFLMKNNFNYKDQTEVVQTTTTVDGASSDELIQKYDVIDADFKEVE